MSGEVIADGVVNTIAKPDPAAKNHGRRLIPREQVEIAMGRNVRGGRRNPVIKLKRVYDEPDSVDGLRYLVERLWPRGIRKASLHLDGWFKEAAPSTELRKWFNHDPAKWEEFRRRYFAELDGRPEALETIREASRDNAVTLLYSSHNTEHNNAVALKEYLERKSHKPRK